MCTSSTRSYLPMKREQTECTETSEHKIQPPRNHPEEKTQHSEHGESLKTGTLEYSEMDRKFYIHKQEKIVNEMNIRKILIIKPTRCTNFSNLFLD